jgi:phage-related protein
MASKNQVTLTLAGDSSNLEKAMERVGASSRGMSDDIDKASRSAGEGFDKMGDGIDNTGSKAGDMESGFRGVTDSMGGFSKLAKGDVMGGLTDMAGGAEALATGFSGVLIPALKKSKVGMAAMTVATKAQTIAMRASNMVMRANPIGLVITAIFLLVGAFILAYKKSETFRNIVDGAMKRVRSAFDLVVDKGKDLVGWFKDAPGKIRGAFSGLASIIKSPFTTAFGAIKSLWNSTVGGFGFSVPDWIPKIGGKSFSIPSMHTGGVMPGAPGTQGLALLMAGERVSTPGSSGGRTVIELRSSGSKVDDMLVELLRGAIRTRGGDVQVVLGR